MRAGKRLILAVNILQLLFEAGKTGRGATTPSMVKETDFGTEAVERMLFALHQKKYLENTSSDTWVLARRLNDVTLHDLMRSLEIGFNPDDLSIASDSWRQRLQPPLQDLLKGEKKATDVFLQDIFESHGDTNGKHTTQPHLKPVS